MCTSRLCGITAVLISTALIAFASPQGPHTLQGKVVLANGAPPSNSVRVTLTFNGIRIYETFTDLSGRFSFSGLRTGVYQLEAEGDGKSFETTRVTAEVSAFGGAPQTFTQNVALRPIKGKPVPPAELVSAETVDPALPRQARDAFKKGARLADDNKPEDAIKQFKQAVAAAPDFYLAHLTLGDQYLKLRKFDESLTAYEKARELRPQRAEPISGIGAVLIQLQKYADALPLLRQVIQMGGQTAVTYLYAGLAETMTSEYEAAETDLKRALELNKSPVARVYLANLYELKGDPQSAIDQLKAFLNENPNAPQVQQVREAVEKLRKKIQKKQR